MLSCLLFHRERRGSSFTTRIERGPSKCACSASTKDGPLVCLLYRLHKPLRDIWRNEHNPARIFSQFVDLDQQHARPVLLEHVFELVDQIFPLTHPLYV